MAKWGEGDPRWIVEERPDATNVNNWHWTEKNATPWSKDKLKALLDGFVISEAGLECTVTKIDKLDGEATANNRKGKLIFFYEWNIVLLWTGRCNDEEVTGKVSIPNLSEENDVDEVELTVSVDSSNPASEKLKLFMYNIGREKLRKQLDTYIRQLKADFAKGLILPKKDELNGGETVPVKKDKETVYASGFNKKKVDLETVTSDTTKPIGGVKLDVKTLKTTEKFQCRANELFDALTREDMVTAFTRGYVKQELFKGGDFVYFGGNISGKFEDIVPNQKLVQTWRYKQWPSGHYSTVTIELDEKEDHTELKLTQTMIPAAEYEMTRQNWQRYYWDSIRSAFGFGSFLY
ncbi:activator of 90 kDa heat shock protein ATPase homolog 1 [Anopheles ziemanni]|uniref:activator of 90 kDa heat shock protein ATPase homolog 1 n=1 Tax=Anopheles coustani TaxID=139045 RepID=UPI0026591FF6|nr:activator of 90 kDa heat shock protein ATPase homolog 1 [Anopheles coustani]XP_058175288.1 activator of 90 kDa heat shock protein ATPase homolog 1 [Anopheles ziemanni]